MKIAIVYDRLNQFGGAERILLALAELWPEAPIFTSVYNKDTAKWASVFPEIHTTFLQKLPFSKNLHEIYAPLMPLAFESLNFDDYDVVISVTSESAKGIITKPHTLHISYILTPTRYLWSGLEIYKKTFQIGMLTPLFKIFHSLLLSPLRIWDKIAAKRPDYLLAISQNTAARIKKYYAIDSEVIYPPVDLEKFSLSKVPRKNYFLLVGRQVAYKRLDIAIKAFNILGWELKVIGTGRENNNLRRLAFKNITFEENVTDEELVLYYQTCRALIFTSDEDLGLTPIEAAATGTPVIAYECGGVLESIKEGTSGEFFDSQNEHSLIKTLLKFDKKHYNSNDIRKNVLKFDKNIFKTGLKKLVETRL